MPKKQNRSDGLSLAGHCERVVRRQTRAYEMKQDLNWRRKRMFEGCEKNWPRKPALESRVEGRVRKFLLKLPCL